MITSWGLLFATEVPVLDQLSSKYVREWTDSSARQVTIRDRKVSSDSMTEPRFTPISTIEELGEVIRRGMMSSELDDAPL
jgi:hypothetical protein